MSWYEAQQSCVDKGGFLATIRDGRENAILLVSVTANTWIGGYTTPYYTYAEGLELLPSDYSQFKWIGDNSEILYAYWAPGYPRGRSGIGDVGCIQMYGGGITFQGGILGGMFAEPHIERQGTWVDTDCHQKNFYACSCIASPPTAPPPRVDPPAPPSHPLVPLPLMCIVYAESPSRCEWTGAYACPNWLYPGTSGQFAKPISRLDVSFICCCGIEIGASIEEQRLAAWEAIAKPPDEFGASFELAMKIKNSTPESKESHVLGHSHIVIMALMLIFIFTLLALYRPIPDYRGRIILV